MLLALLLDVRAAGPKGLGAFAPAPIAEGAHVCDYEGELLSLQQVEDRYGYTPPDFLLGIGDDAFLDAAQFLKLCSSQCKSSGRCSDGDEQSGKMPGSKSRRRMPAGAPVDNHTGSQWPGPRAAVRHASNNGAWIFVIGLLAMYELFIPT